MSDDRRWTTQPAGANWSAFAPEDQVGMVGTITPAMRRAAAAEIVEGLSFPLSLPLDRPGGDYHGLGRRGPVLSPLERRGAPAWERTGWPRHTDVFSDDQAVLSLQASTHWDALRHGGAMYDKDGSGVRATYWNGWPGGEAAGQPARHLTIDRLAATGLQGRGVLLDLMRAFGPERRAVGMDDLRAVMAAQKVTVERGDILLLHTGQMQALLDHGPSEALQDHGFCHLDGADEDLQAWIAETGLVAIAADNYAVEIVPATRAAPGGPAEPLHDLCLFRLGIPLGELWHLSDLAAWLAGAGRSRVFLTAPPLRLPGAVAGPVTPVATV